MFWLNLIFVKRYVFILCTVQYTPVRCGTVCICVSNSTCMLIFDIYCLVKCVKWTLFVSTLTWTTCVTLESIREVWSHLPLFWSNQSRFDRCFCFNARRLTLTLQYEKSIADTIEGASSLIWLETFHNATTSDCTWYNELLHYLLPWNLRGMDEFCKYTHLNHMRHTWIDPRGGLLPFAVVLIQSIEIWSMLASMQDVLFSFCWTPFDVVSSGRDHRL